MGLLEELKERQEKFRNDIKVMSEREEFVTRCLRDLDCAIAALEMEAELELEADEQARGALSVPEVAEVEIPEGFVRNDSGECPVADGTVLNVMWINCTNDEVYFEQHTHTSGMYAGSWAREDGCDTIHAYHIISVPVLPSEPAAEAKGEDDTPVYGDDLAYGDGNDARIGNMPIECNPYEGKEAEYWNNGWTDADAIIQLNECAPDTITIASSSQHAEESARAREVLDAILTATGPLELGTDTAATQIYMDGDQLVVREVTASEFYAQPEVDVTPPAQDLPPLFPPEPPQPATPESLEATGVIDSEASWWARQLAKVEA